MIQNYRFHFTVIMSVCVNVCSNNTSVKVYENVNAKM